VLAGTAWLIGTGNVEFSLTIFISVLVIACALACNPAAIMVGTGKGAENGILIKSGIALETAHQINTIVFDKTGTEGKPMVTDSIPASAINPDYLLQITASAEEGSEHPRATVSGAQEKGLELFTVQDFESLTGRGTEGQIQGRPS
jgi:Cu+-exporting ATPase